MRESKCEKFIRLSDNKEFYVIHFYDGFSPILASSKKKFLKSLNNVRDFESRFKKVESEDKNLLDFMEDSIQRDRSTND